MITGRDVQITRYQDSRARNGAAKEPKCATGNRLRFELRQAGHDLHRLETQWRQLESKANTPVFFQSYSWVNHVARVLSKSETAFQPIILTAWLDQELVAVWPLRQYRCLGSSLVSDLGDPFGQYSEIIVSEKCDTREILGGMLQHIAQSISCDGLLLRKVRSGSNLEQLISMGATRQNIGFKAPWVSFNSYESFDEYMSTLNSKTRKNLRNFRNRLLRQGSLEHTVISDHSAIGPALIDIFVKRKNWLLDRGLTSSAFRHPMIESFVTSLADDKSASVSPLVTALLHNGSPIASQLGFVHNNRYYAYISARDAEIDSSVSAGRLHLEEILRACHERRIAEVDLLAPANPYKMTWTKKTEDVYDLFRPLTQKGDFIGNQVIGRAVPAVRGIFSKLPTAVRRPLADIFNASTGTK